MEAKPDLSLKSVGADVGSAGSCLDDIPVINLDLFVSSVTKDEAALVAESVKVAECLHKYGILIVKDSRVDEADNSKFIDLLERYFELPYEVKLKDIRPDFHYQVGATPDHVELPRDHCSKMKDLPEGSKALSLCPPEKDPKWRYFWRVGDRPKVTKFVELNAEGVVPASLKDEWPATMNMWGSKMMQSLSAAAGMAAIGLGLEANTFIDWMNCGPHLLAPTGSDFYNYGAEGTVLAGYHYDLNFMTIHGKSRFPGLYIWLRDGRKVSVKVPDGCLLIQAGAQFEYITAGHVLKGFHEVVVNADTVKTIARRREEGKSLWRVSSTVFGHIASDVVLQPLGKFAALAEAASYPPIFAGDQVSAELEAISLKAT